jgi:hypothetical protein
MLPDARTMEAPRQREVVGRITRYSSDSSVADFAEQAGELATIVLGPGDSHYELPALFDDDGIDSQVELPAFVAEPIESDSLNANAITGATIAADLRTNAWIYRHFDSWGRSHVLATLVIGIGALAGLAFCLVRSLIVGTTVGSSIIALVLACVGLAAFLLLSLTATPFYLHWFELTSSVRALPLRSTANRQMLSE